MSTAALPPRRSARSAARRAAAAAGDDDSTEPAGAPAAESLASVEQPRKRQRKASAAASALLASNAAAEAAPEEQAGAAAAKRGGGRGKGKAAAGGPSREYEQELWDQGYRLVAGVDEAGRGPLAGPVVAAACIVPPHVEIAGVDDSKKLTAEAREAIYEQLTTHPDVKWAAKTIDAGEIDTINILQAALKAMEGAAAGLPEAPDFLLVDGNRLPKGFDPERARPVVKGDSKVLCIAAASVIAKVTRDRLMEAYHQTWPQYNFAGHKGYCVPEHVEAIRRHGPCPVHRRTFAPIKTWFPLEPAAEQQGGGKGGSSTSGKGDAKKGRRGGKRGKAAAADE
ncbi:hypothetical protein ABPG75_003867 [Micractinium tetrahymenae]